MHFSRSFAATMSVHLMGQHLAVNLTVCVARHPGFNFSAEFRRNFGFFSFPLVTGIRNFGIFRYIPFSNSKFNKFRPKFTEIHRNLPKFRNEISFPLNTGISSENEMVNPGCRSTPPAHHVLLHIGRHRQIKNVITIGSEI